jgi:hypothetical protein
LLARREAGRPFRVWMSPGACGTVQTKRVRAKSKEGVLCHRREYLFAPAQAHGAIVPCRYSPRTEEVYSA